MPRHGVRAQPFLKGQCLRCHGREPMDGFWYLALNGKKWIKMVLIKNKQLWVSWGTKNHRLHRKFLIPPSVTGKQQTVTLLNQHLGAHKRNCQNTARLIEACRNHSGNWSQPFHGLILQALHWPGKMVMMPNLTEKIRSRWHLDPHDWSSLPRVPDRRPT